MRDRQKKVMQSEPSGRIVKKRWFLAGGFSLLSNPHLPSISSSLSIPLNHEIQEDGNAEAWEISALKTKQAS